MESFNPTQLVARLHQLKEYSHLDLNSISLNTGIDVGLLSLYFAREKIPHDFDIKRLAKFFDVSMSVIEGKASLPTNYFDHHSFYSDDTTWFKVKRTNLQAIKKEVTHGNPPVFEDDDVCLSALPISHDAFAIEASLPIATIDFESHPAIAFIEKDAIPHPGCLVMAWERGPNIIGIYYYQLLNGVKTLHRRRPPSPGIIVSQDVHIFGCLAHMDIAGIFTFQT